MPRTARKKSESGFYHILLRGIGRQSIFEDDADRHRFITTVGRYKAELGFEIHAYCLMGNHVHVLLEDINRQVDLIIKKIAGSYAHYFNWKYERAGHLFQDRFKSEVVEDDRYFLTVLRYIHQNPQKAGIASVGEYKWSSHGEYINKAQLVKTAFALGILGGRQAYLSFMEQEEQESCLETEDKCRLTDEEAIDIIKRVAAVKSVQQVQKLEGEKRGVILVKLKEKGLSVRQIERLTGVNRGVVFRT